jgi:hypothetical protein
MRYVDKCLRSVLNTDYAEFEVIFVDNASTDGSLEYVKERFNHDPRLKIVRNDANYGFAEGNNIGLRLAKGKYVAFLNNDTEVDPKWLKELVKVLNSNQNLGAAQSKLLLLHNHKKFDTCGHMLTQFGFTIERGAGEKDIGQYDYVAEILGAKGAALIVRKKVLEEVGLFDPDYFALREETDLCWRIWLRGYTVAFVPKSIVYHAGGGVSKQVDISGSVWHRVQLFYWYRNTLMTLTKNLELKNAVKIIPLHLFLAFLDALIVSLMSRSFHSALSLLKAVTWILTNFRLVWKKRVTVQSTVRMKRDEEIMPHIMVKIAILDKLRERAILSFL